MVAFGSRDAGAGWSLGISLSFLRLCLGVVAWVLRSGCRLRA